MANRIVQTIYDLKDRVSGKLRDISGAWNRHKGEATSAGRKIEGANERLSRSYGRVSKSVSGLRNALRVAFSAATFAAIGAGIGKILGIGSEFEQLGKKFEALFGGVEAGKAALKEVADIARTTPLALEEVADAAARAKAFGLDPLDGTLRKLIDTNAALGGNYQTLEGIVTAFGQAQAKNKLQTEEINQLLERGVPVYEALEAALGKTTAQIQKMASAGELGRDEVRALIDELGEKNLGAAANAVDSLAGTWSNFKDRVTQIMRSLAEGGLMDFVKVKLNEIGDSLDRLAASGELQRRIEAVAGALVSIGKAAAAVTVFVAEHIRAIAALGVAYGALKLGGLVKGLAGLAGGFSGIKSAATGLRALLGRVALGFAGVGAAALATTALVIKAIADIRALNRAKERWADIDKGLAAKEEAQAAKVAQLLAEYQRFADTAIKSTEELAALRQTEAQDYATAVAGAIKYYQALRVQAKNAGDAAGMADARAKVDELRASLDAAAKAIDSVTAAAREATPSVLGMTDQLASIGDSAEIASEKIGKLFDGIDFDDARQLGTAAIAIEMIGDKSADAGDAVRAGLGAALRKLSTDDLARFENAAQDAFANLKVGATESAVVMDSVLAAAADKLGVALVDAGEDAIKQLRLIASTGRASAEVLGDSFEAALGTLDEASEIEAFRKTLEDAFAASTISAAQYNEQLAALEERLRQIMGLQDQPAPDLGLEQTQQQLEDVGQAAEQAGEQIEDGIQRGTGLAASLAAAMGAAREEFVALSDAAAKLFDEGVERRFSGGGILTLALEDYKDALAESARVTREAIERQRADLAGLVSSIGEIGAAASEGFAQFDGSIVTTQQRIAGLLADVESGTTNFRLLGEEELQPLQAALEAARQRTQALQEAALQAAQQLEQMAQASQDAIDRAQGDDKSIEDRRFQRELERIQELAEKGGAAAREQAERARKLSRQEHEIRLREIEERKRAEIDADNKVADLDQARRRRDQAGGGDVGGGSGGGSGAGGLGPATKIDINLHATSVDEQSFKALVRRIKTEFDAIARRSR